MATEYDVRRTQDNLASYFNKSAAAVRQYSEVFEQRYARPAVGYGLTSFESHPITSTFVAIFSVLSLLPVVSFIGFSLFVMASVFFVALSSAILVILAAEFVLASFLLSAQAFILFMAFFLTTFVISAYLCIRFITLVRDHGRAGARQWVIETKDHFISKPRGSLPARKNENSSRFDNPKGEPDHDLPVSEDEIKVRG